MFRTSNKQGFNNLTGTYRYISVFLTILTYVVRGIYEQYDYSIMLLLVCSIVFSVFLLNYLYIKNNDNKHRMFILLTIEISGLSFLMYITGGLSSPFIWCFLNPLLIISCFSFSGLKILFLTANFLLLCFIGYIKENTMTVGEYLSSRSNIILSYLLILILINILLDYNRRILKKQEQLQEAKEQLEISNTRIQGIINDILCMYEAVQAIPSQRDKRGIVNIILDFAERISPMADAFFIQNNGYKTESSFFAKTVDESDAEEFRSFSFSEIPWENVWTRTTKTGKLAAMIKVANIRDYGVIGLLLPVSEYNIAKAEYDSNLLLFSKLSATFFDKIESDTVSYVLAVADEQNRIAEDIHDSVVQRLFAVSCFAYDLIRKWEQVPDEEKKKQVTMVMETIQSSLKDLRSTIYNLSDRMQQADQFQESITGYLKNMGKLSGIDIHINMEGNFNDLTVGARKALYRIIAECAGNAIKHAKCKNVYVDLKINEEQTNLVIEDDGTGFDINKAEQEKKGLGLYNIKSLVRIFNGIINIKPGKFGGAAFNIEFANSDVMKKEEGI